MFDQIGRTKAPTPKKGPTLAVQKMLDSSATYCGVRRPLYGVLRHLKNYISQKLQLSSVNFVCFVILAFRRLYDVLRCSNTPRCTDTLTVSLGGGSFVLVKVDIINLDTSFQTARPTAKTVFTTSDVSKI